MAANRQRFYNKWRTTLETQHAPPSVPFDTAATQRYSYHVLWVDDMIPEPDGDSGSVRMSHLWDVMLAEGAHITFHPNMFRWMKYALQARLRGVQIVLDRRSLAKRWVNNGINVEK